MSSIYGMSAPVLLTSDPGRTASPLVVTLKAGKSPKKPLKAEELRRASAMALAYSNTVRWTDGDGEMTAFTDASTEVWCAAGVEAVMSRLVRTNKPLFTRTKTMGGRERWVATPLGKEFIGLLGPNGGFRSVMQEFEHHAFHPLIELFWKHAEPLAGLHSKLTMPGEVEAVMACAKAIRKEARTPGFRKRRSKHLKHVRQNTESLLTYIDGLFDHRGRHLVLRLDTGYQRDFVKGAGDAAIDYAQVREHREAFLAYLQSASSPVVLRGFAWSLEMGRTASYHLHWLLFIDGHESQQDITVARLLGEHWAHVITDGKGRYHNCNADHHVRRGVGMIDYWNSDRMKNLKEVVAPYLTKQDYLIRTLVEDGKTFSHGRLPSEPPKSGRPRKYVGAAAVT